jgi:HSP20 family molecular chaperone IbpA
MAMLTAYDPFAATSAAFRALDQLTGRPGGLTARPLSGMPMDAYRVGDNFVAHFDLPGVDPGSIDLQVEGTYPVTEEQWTTGERTFYCFVTRGGGSKITADVQGTAGQQG